MSDEETRETSRPLPGLALLSWLWPPPGYVTDRALGTSYSLDLVTAATALVALDGAACDRGDYNLVATLRAMHRLAERVRIVVQEGCIHWDANTKRTALTLLDRVVRTVRTESGHSFHPKVWVVRQRPEESDLGPVRYVLVVGSRNLTRDLSWDLGVALEGYVGEPGGLEGHGELVDFVRFVSQAAEEPELTKYFPDLGSVAWKLPREAREARFGFHGRDRLAWPDTALLSLPEDADRVLILSPFLDATAVQQVARRWRDVPERRLVAGSADLDVVAERHGEALMRLEPRAMEPARAEPVARRGQHDLGEEAGDLEDPESAEGSRGLHAKVYAVCRRRRAEVLLGSSNLTTRGWSGVNTEAWLLLRGERGLADALWDWAGRQAMEYHPPESGPVAPDAEAKVLDDHHGYVAARHYTLHEQGRGEARLEADKPPLGDRRGAPILKVGRLSQPGVTVPWTPEAPATALPGCEPEERTELLIFTMRTGTGERALERSWVQRVTVTPPLEDERDGALMARVLGPAQFLEYLRGYLDPSAGDGPDSPDTGEAAAARSGHTRSVRRRDELRIETILRALAKSAQDPKQVVAHLGKAISQYRAAPNANDAPELGDLWAAWAAIEEVYGR